ncbi:MAG: CBS domain-containing protein [Gemmatimonadota bacterium]
MKMKEILGRKGREVVTVREDLSVLDAVGVLVERNIGSVVVVREGAPAGILTERDVLRLTSEHAGKLDRILVSDAMVRDLITASPEDELGDVMEVMTARKVRHVPVVEDGALVGIVSIGDLVNACLALTEEENLHLRRYIHGVA